MRQLLGLLFRPHSPEEISALDIPGDQNRPGRINNLHQLWQLGRNAPHTSSIGRLFDAVAALFRGDRHPGLRGRSGTLAGGSRLAAGPDEQPFPRLDLSQSAEGPLHVQWATHPYPCQRAAPRHRHCQPRPPVLSAHQQSGRCLPSASPAIRWRSGAASFQNRVLMDQLVPALKPPAGRY